MEGFHSRDLYSKVNHFKVVAMQENNNSDSKTIICLISFVNGFALIIPACNVLQLQTKMNVRCLET